VFREYWNNPEATAASFTPDGWFRTGDIAVRERGYYRIMGRQSVDIIKSGGYKLSALEIEGVLLEHPGIAECAVLGLPDATWGEVVAAAVVLREDTRLDAEELRDWCEHQLSSYKQPRRFVFLPALPRNAMGKVVKPDLWALFAA
jgi:malonyl-CoA/methylmalonyl-CoA synthetase